MKDDSDRTRAPKAEDSDKSSKIEKSDTSRKHDLVSKTEPAVETAALDNVEKTEVPEATRATTGLTNSYERVTPARVLDTQTSSGGGYERGKRRGKYFAALILIVLLSFTAGITGAWIVGKSDSRSSSSLNAGADGNATVTAEEEGISGVASKVSASVVSILTQSERQSYFGNMQALQGAGTGIIVSKDGYILTNKHVVEGSNTLSVVTSDGTSYDGARVVGTDPLNDVAFLKINGVNDLKVAELGDSSTLRIGQSVVAIGNALGQYQNTVTSGIVSGTGRSVTASAGAGESSVETLTDLIQTDAAINPGNSGGPLVNLSGQVIGINTAIASEANGVGFSIPINAVKGLLKGILQDGKAERAYVGVNYITITPDVAKEFKLSVTKGAYVHSSNNQSAVATGSPAERAGIKDGDIITKVNGTEVGDRGSVSSLVAEFAPGDKITVTLLRDGRTQTIDVTLAAYPN